MKNAVLALLLIVVASQASASEPYRFQLDAGGRSVRMTSESGTRWKVLVYRCGTTTPDCGFQFNHARGEAAHGNSAADPYDIRLASLSDDTVNVVSLRDVCRVRVAGRDRVIRRGEQLQLNVGTKVEVACD